MREGSGGEVDFSGDERHVVAKLSSRRSANLAFFIAVLRHRCNVDAR